MVRVEPDRPLELGDRLRNERRRGQRTILSHLGEGALIEKGAEIERGGRIGLRHGGGAAKERLGLLGAPALVERGSEVGGREGEIGAAEIEPDRPLVRAARLIEPPSARESVPQVDGGGAGTDRRPPSRSGGRPRRSARGGRRRP